MVFMKADKDQRLTITFKEKKVILEDAYFFILLQRLEEFGASPAKIGD